MELDSDYTTYWEKATSVTATMPSRSSWTVALNANGGTGGTASLTKWHNDPLSLTSGFTAPTKTGYRFDGWAASSGATVSDKMTSYTANSAGTVYAIWTPLITDVTVGVHTLRVADGTSTAEADEGTWCYGTLNYEVAGGAQGELNLVVTADNADVEFDSSDPTAYEVTVLKGAGVTLSGTAVFRAQGCSTEENIKFTVAASAANISAPDETDVTDSASDILSAAYFPLDILGDAYYYNSTTDTAIDTTKKYYTRTGDGSAQNPYVYTLVEETDPADIGDYYEANGERPGHGIALGLPAKKEGFAVGMDLFLQRWAGVIQMFAGSAPPAGWLLCDGSAVSRTEYATLYAAIGDTWGAGDGSTTFNLPDLRGRATIGAGAGSGLTARTLGGTGGSEDAVIPYHRHAMGAHTHAHPGEPYLGNSEIVARRTVASGSGATNQLYSSGTTGRYNNTGAMNGSPYTGYAGSSGNTDNANMQPYAVVNYIIHTGKTN
ncbi:MAG: tail fiber protein [Eggerthellaceae bacterium]|nr:tail fiber protein [Eggerthellaceae bacterium]